MNIDWNDAPDWANWAAKDESGDWFWYEREPKFSDVSGEWFAFGEIKRFAPPEDSLVQRPIED